MATQRVTPQENFQNQSIQFTYVNNQLTVTSPGLIINQGDTVVFSSSSTSTAAISISFLTGPQPPNIAPIPAPFQNVAIPPGGSNPQTAPMSDVSVNYTVSAGGQTFGPYAIQVGVGPVYVQITNSAPDQTQVAIPEGGWLEMFSTDVTYYLNWTTLGNPFPGLTTVYQATTTGNPNIPYQNSGGRFSLFSYQISTTPPPETSSESEGYEQPKPIEISKSEVPRVGTGTGGRVIIQST